MWNIGKLKSQRMSILVASVLAAITGWASLADEPRTPQEIISIRRDYELITENNFGDGRTTRILRMSPSETGEPGEIVELRRILPNGQIITIRLPEGDASGPAGDFILVDKAYQSAAKESDTAKGSAAPGRFQVSPSGNSAILVDTVTGKTWLLYYPDRRILSRLSAERGNSWKDMPCIWLPLHRPESEAEIQQILARERALREASERLRAEEQEKLEEERRNAFGTGGARRNADGKRLEPRSE